MYDLEISVIIPNSENPGDIGKLYGKVANIPHSLIGGNVTANRRQGTNGAAPLSDTTPCLNFWIWMPLVCGVCPTLAW